MQIVSILHVANCLLFVYKVKINFLGKLKKKKNNNNMISLPSAEFAQRMVQVKK